MSNRNKGQYYEQCALTYLTQQGLRFIEQNFITKMGEIDLVMKDAQYIVFVEVKYRKHSAYGSASEMVDARKKQKLIKSAHFWLKKHDFSIYHSVYRFDVVAISGHDENLDVQWIKNAITQE